MPESKLERAVRHVIEGRRIVERQRALVWRMQHAGRDWVEAESLLTTFERSLATSSTFDGLKRRGIDVNTGRGGSNLMDATLRVTANQHRGQAARYRQLAAEATTPRMKEQLLDLARASDRLAEGGRAPAAEDASDQHSHPAG